VTSERGGGSLRRRIAARLSPEAVAAFLSVVVVLLVLAAWRAGVLDSLIAASP
jgi:hypothetical protein